MVMGTHWSLDKETASGRIEGPRDISAPATMPTASSRRCNPKFPDPAGRPGDWVSPWHFGLNERPIVAMIENHQTGMVWQLLRGCPYLVAGLLAAGFTHGWLSPEDVS
jgi:hypothetical protein